MGFEFQSIECGFFHRTQENSITLLCLSHKRGKPKFKIELHVGPNKNIHVPTKTLYFFLYKAACCSSLITSRLTVFFKDM